MNFSRQQTQEKKKTYKNNQENGNRNIHIDNYLKVNGLNPPTKRQRLAEWIQNKTCICTVCKRPTSNLGTHID